MTAPQSKPTAVEGSQPGCAELLARENDAEIARITGLLFDEINKNKALTKALEPFAKLAAFVVEAHRDSRPIVFGLDHVIVQRLTIGDLRAAGRAVVVPLEQRGGK